MWVKSKPVLVGKGMCVVHGSTAEAAAQQTTQEKQNLHEEPAFLQLSLIGGFSLCIYYVPLASIQHTLSFSRSVQRFLSCMEASGT